MVERRGFGGESEFWDHRLESVTLMACRRGKAIGVAPLEQFA